MTDKTQSLGEFLRHERERRGITIEQLASATKIGVRLLHSLEADHYADLPAKPFIRGFVTSYARFIGLDPKETLIRFNDFIEQRAHDRPTRDSGHSGYAFEKKEQSRSVLWFMIGAFVLLGGIGIIVLKPNLKRHHHGSHAEKLQEAYLASPSPGPSSDPSPGPSGAPSATPSTSASPSPIPSPAPVAVPTSAPSSSPPSSPTSPSPAPEVTAAKPESAPTPKPIPSANPKDPLNSGLNIKSAAIKQKVLFRALSGVSVRYQVDDLPVMNLKVGKDKLLVLRALRKIVIQVGRAEALEYSHNGGAYQSIKVGENAERTQGAITLRFPVEPAEITKEPFPGAGDFSFQ